MFEFDHLVIAAERLEEGVAWAEERLGVTLQAGGAHARYGTHNALLGLEGGAYLEVISTDPCATPEHLPRWFGLDSFAGDPRLTNWVCRTAGLGSVMPSLPKGFGSIAALSRGDLNWGMAETASGGLPFDQCFPGVIDWGNSPHPAGRLKPSGLSFEGLELRHPHAEALREALGGLLSDSRVTIVPSVLPEMQATLRHPDGTAIKL